MDRDEEFIKGLEHYKIQPLVFFQDQKESVTAYYNFLFSKSRGKVIWPLHDDCKVMTPEWDTIASKNIEGKWDNIWLGDVVDLVVEIDRYRCTQDNFGGRISGMPMISRKAVETLDTVFPREFKHWGGTNVLNKIHQFAGTIIPIDVCVIHDPVKDETYDKIRKWWVQDTGGKVTMHDLKSRVEKIISASSHNVQ